MNRSELIDHVASAAGLDKKAAEAAVAATTDAVVAEIKKGEKVSLFGFGTFTPTSRAARTGRNPQTGVPVKISASNGVRFAPSTAFKASLNAKAAAKKGAAAKKAGSARGAAPAKSGAANKAAKATTATKAPTKTSKAPTKATKATKAPTKATKATKKRG